MKLAAFVALSLPLAALLAGCMGEEPVDTSAIDPKDLAVTSEKNADGSFTFKVPELAGLDYTWDFGDFTSPMKGATAKHTFGVVNGLFSVVVTAKGADGKELRVGKQHIVGTGANSPPTASLTVAAPVVKVGEPFAVDASASKDADGDKLTVSWIASPATAAAAPEPAADPHAGHMLTGMAAADTAASASTDGAHAHSGGLPDTGSLAKGATKSLTFTAEGVYQYHCHPHPHMVGKVIVASGGAKNATVDIEQFSFQPGVVRIAPGGSVTFTNKDDIPHTATVAGVVPKGTVLPLKTMKGEVTLAEKGSFDLTVVLEDGKGQIATATQRIAVGDEAGSSTFEENFTGDFGQAPVLVPAAGKDAQKRHSFEIKYPGHAIVTGNQTTGTPGAGKLQFRLLDEAGTEIAAGAEMSLKLPAGTYFAEASPAAGENVVYGVSYAIHVLVHLDLAGGAPAGEDGHGHEH